MHVASVVQLQQTIGDFAGWHVEARCAGAPPASYVCVFSEPPVAVRVPPHVRGESPVWVALMRLLLGAVRHAPIATSVDIEGDDQHSSVIVTFAAHHEGIAGIRVSSWISGMPVSELPHRATWDSPVMLLHALRELGMDDGELAQLFDPLRPDERDRLSDRLDYDAETLLMWVQQAANSGCTRAGLS